MAKLAATVRQHKKTERRMNPKSALSVAAATDVTRWLLPLTVVVFTLLAFLPSLQNGFVNWDDPANLLENPHYRGLTWAHLYWMLRACMRGTINR